MITASGEQEKVRAIEAGADDFVSKPFNQGELLARVASLARVKRYQDTIERQAAELAQWNAELEARVDAQVDELQRVNRLRRFLSPQLVDLVIDSGDEAFLDSHRREIVVVFCDLRGFTPFAESSEPEEVMGVLAEYHEALGRADLPVRGHPRALHRRRADGVLQRPAARRRRRPSARSRWRSRCATGSPSSQRAGAAAATTSGSASASPRASPRSAGSGSRGASTTPRSAASRTSRRACARRRAVADPRRAAGVLGDRGHRRRASRSASSTCEGFSRPGAGIRRHGHRRDEGEGRRT